MKKPLKILFATDYSDPAINAGRYALQMAKATSSIVSFIHVYEAPISVMNTEPIEYADTMDKFIKAENEILEMHRQKLVESVFPGMQTGQFECIVREGNAGIEIRKEAQEMEADLIIMGTHGVSGIQRVLFGTHTWDVIKNAEIPVLAIPIEAEWKGIHHITFASGEREGEIPAINYLVQMASEFNAEITVLHLSNYSVSEKFEAEMFARFRDEVKEKVSYNLLNLRLEFSNDIIQGINDFCMRYSSDWLVMSPEKRTLFEKVFLPTLNISKNLSFQSKVCLLSIPDYFNPEYSSFWRIFELEEKYLDHEY